MTTTEIMKIVSKHFEYDLFSEAELRKTGRYKNNEQNYVWAKHAFYYFSAKFSLHSYVAISENFSQKHSSVVSAIKTVNKFIQTNDSKFMPMFRKCLYEIKEIALKYRNIKPEVTKVCLEVGRIKDIINSSDANRNDLLMQLISLSETQIEILRKLIVF